MSAAFTAFSTTKAKSRSTGWNGDNSSRSLARVAFALGSGIFSRITSNATSGPSALSAASARGCNSPKAPSTFCGPIWMVPLRPGWNQAGAPGTTCKACIGAPAWFHPGRSGTIQIGPQNVLGAFGELHPRAIAALKAEGPLVAFEVLLEKIPEPKAKPTRAKPLLELSPFQPVERDFAFVVDAKVKAADIVRAAQS